jgi:DHA1 family inner membrane transport protein
MLRLLAAGNFIVGIGAFSIIGLMSPLQGDLGLTPLAAGSVVSAYALAYAFASPVLTAVLGRADRRPVLAAALAMFGAGMLLAAVARGVTGLYAGRIVASLGAAVFTPAAATVAVAGVAPGARGRALALIFTGFTLAQVVGVPASSWLGYTFGWRAVFAGIGILAGLVALLVLARLPRGIVVPPTTLGAFGRVLKDPGLALSALFLCSSMAAAWVSYTFLGPMIEWKLAGGRDVVSMLMLVYGLGALVGNILGGRVTDRLGPDRTLLVIAGLNVVLLLAVPTLPWTFLTGALLLFAWAVNGWAVMVPQQARLVGLAPGESQILLALNASGIYIGGAVGSVIGAATLAQTGGYWWTGPVGALAGLLSLAHLLAAFRLTRRRAAPAP